MSTTMGSLMELNALAKEDGKKYVQKRELFKQIASQKGKHFMGMVGPRGVGKTVLLKQLALSSDHSFYISLDTLQDEDVFEIAKLLVEKHKIKVLLLDEVHFQKDFDQVLKKIFDFLTVQVVFTSSVALSMIESAYDLSRRVSLEFLYPFTFRQYLYFKKGILLPQLSLEQIAQGKWDTAHLEHQYLFEDYLKGGLYPFTLEEPDTLPLFKNILDKVIHKDIPSVAKLHTAELPLIEKTLSFIGKSVGDGINYTSISKNVGITKYKAEAYVQLLEKAFILNPIFPEGANVLREPKILMSLPYRILYKEYDEAIGAIREDFFAQMLKIKGIKFGYLKSTRGEKTPDFLVNLGDRKMVIEIGGKGKGRQQFKGIAAQEKLVLTHAENPKSHQVPLFLLGFI